MRHMLNKLEWFNFIFVSPLVAFEEANATGKVLGFFHGRKYRPERGHGQGLRILFINHVKQSYECTSLMETNRIGLIERVINISFILI